MASSVITKHPCSLGDATCGVTRVSLLVIADLTSASKQAKMDKFSRLHSKLQSTIEARLSKIVIAALLSSSMA